MASRPVTQGRRRFRRSDIAAWPSRVAGMTEPLPALARFNPADLERPGRLVGQEHIDIPQRPARFDLLAHEMPPLEQKQGEIGHVAACWVTK